MGPNIEKIKRLLYSIVGNSNLKDSKFELKSNSSDASEIKASPLLVVYPSDKNQIVQIIKLANKEKISIVPRGGGSGLSGGASADNSIVLNLTRMDNVKINKKSCFVIVQPGIILDKLNNKLSKSGMYLPVQPASHGIASIGGMVSTNAGGEHALRFGKMGENILSLEVVAGDGRLLKVKGKRVHDFCGTEGIIGIVVEAKLRIIPSLGKRTITIRYVKDIQDLMRLVNFFIKDKSVISCEFINAKMSQMSRRKNEYFLLIEFKGNGGEIKDKKTIRKYWKIREGCYWFLWRRGWRVASDPKIPLKRMGTFLRWCEKNGVPVFGHIGHGIVHAHLKDYSKVDGMYRLVMRLHGTVSGEHGIGITKKRYLSQSRRNELKKLKNNYDPNKILNIGKVI